MRAIPQNLSIIVVDKLPRWSDNRVVWKYEADGFGSIFGTECLRKGSKMCAESREFVDGERQVTKEWYDLIERAENLGIEGIKMEALKLIKKDPDFLDPYTLLFEILEDNGDSEGAEAMLDEAYTRAVRLITDKDGNWPDSLEWGYPENRHIIRALINKGLWLWSNGENEDALAIFRNLLRTNLNDDIGARFYILGIRMDMGYDEFQDRFDRGGYYDRDIVEWFDANMDKFPEEFPLTD